MNGENSKREDVLSKEIIGATITVHRTLGPGLLESVYELCLFHELEQRGFKARRQVPVPVQYGKLHLECGYRLDLLVEDLVIVELKCAEKIEKIHLVQALTYLRLMALRLCLVINFHAELLKDDGIKRVVLGL